MRREVPADAKRADLKITLPPEAVLDGKADRLSPGARIRNTQNLLIQSASLAGQEVPVMYRRDAAGLIHEVWLLSADEARQRPGRERTVFNIITGTGALGTATGTAP